MAASKLSTFGRADFSCEAWEFSVSTSESFSGVGNGFFAALGDLRSFSLLLLSHSVSVNNISIEDDLLFVDTLSAGTYIISGVVAIFAAMSLEALVIVIDVLEVSDSSFDSSAVRSDDAIVQVLSTREREFLAAAFVTAGLSEVDIILEESTSLFQLCSHYLAGSK